MKDYHVTISELDYEQLPPALRRKYFSSLERLRLAQDGACPSRFLREPQRPLTSSNASSFSTGRSTRRPSTSLDDYTSFTSSSFTTRKRRRQYTRAASVTPQEVAHFASLPATLQRKHYTREEQVLLTSKINHVILDAADEAVYRQYGQQTRLPNTHAGDYFAPSHAFDTHNDDMDFSDDELNNLRWLDEEKDLDLSLFDYHAAVNETTQKDPRSVRRSSYRRGLMISNVHLHRRSSSTNSIGGQKAWPLSAAASPDLSTLQHPGSYSVPSGHRKNRASTSSLDPGAAHYQDPAARMKLRVYLASPQKFDEAIEFGFPSMQAPSVLPQRPTTSPRSANTSPVGFHHDDVPSLSEGDDHEPEDVDSPRTPDMSAFSSALSKSNTSSLDRPTLRPRVVREFLDPYVHAPTSNREMTLHMTLTRPDLRSPDELSSPRDINAQPLEQAPLYGFDANTAFWDNLPDEESKVKKMLRRFKLRS